jgi:peptidase S41-like protein
MRFQHIIRHVGTLAAFSVCAAQAAASAPPTFTPEQLRADLAALATALRDMPPDLAHTTDPRKVWEALDVLQRQIGNASLDREGTWRLFATLNPLLGDGHLFVGFVDWRAEAREHLESGGVFFPFEVKVTPDGEVHVEHALGGVATELAGARLEKINGIDTRLVTTALLARVHGDTPVFRAALLSRRFWLYYWKVFGAPRQFELALAGERLPMRLSGSAALPAVIADEESFDRQFRLELQPDKLALLTVSSFAWSDKAQFLAFTRDAFEKMRVAGTKTLVIDVSANGGGNDEMWIEGLLPYIATRPYRWASRYRKRVVVADPAKHEAVGDIVDGEVETWFPPQPEHPLKFTGKVYVLVGDATYSSAVVFSNVVQDFGFGVVAGPGNSVRAATTGGTRRTTLPNSGLILVAPRFVLTRPSGKTEPALLTPDLRVRDLRQLLDAIAPPTSTR